METMLHGHGGVIPEPKSKVIYKSRKKQLVFKRDRGASKKPIPKLSLKSLLILKRRRTEESRLVGPSRTPLGKDVGANRG
jgi:hypothetical protein